MPDTHYSRYDPQPITIIEKWGFGFHLGSVLEYLVRAPHKGNELRDLRKAKWCLDRYIALRENQIKGTAIPAPDEQA